MKNKLKTIIISVAAISAQVSVASDTMLFVQNISGIKKVPTTPPLVPIDYWMLEANLDNFYPAIGDAGTGGAAGAMFNFGQEPFIGDPRGYQPYDPDFDPSKWSLAPNASRRVVNLSA